MPFEWLTKRAVLVQSGNKTTTLLDYLPRGVVIAKRRTGKLSIGLVSRITGASIRQIDYWTSLGILRSCDYPDHGGWRGYTFRDTVRIAVIVKLRAQGVSLDTIAAITRRLSREGEDLLCSGKLFAYGKKVYVCSNTGEAYDAASRQMTYLFVDLEQVSQPIREAFENAAR